MRTWRTTAVDLLRQWRVARDEAKQAREFLRDRRDAEHDERLRAGIKDVGPNGMF
jgi:hypothetical protein